MSGTVSIDGLITGFNTSDMIEKMMAVERRSVTLLETRQTQANNQLAAFQALNTRLLAFQTTALAVARPAAFSVHTATVSDEAALAATAGTGAPTGTYAITVDALARAHQVASQGFADSDSTTVGTGTIQIQVGDGETATIEVDGGNNTLAGLRDAINAAGAGVHALIVNDGSDAVPYRLMLLADEAGAANTISITADLAGGTAPDWGANSISGVVAKAANTYAGSAASGGTYTGTSSASYLVEIVHGGSLAEATYRISADGGLTWGSTLSLAGGTIDVYDDVHGSDLGVDATFAEGVFAAGDRFTIDAFVPTVQEAADAQITIGSGAGRITVRASSNTVTNVLPGVTLSLKKADPSDPIEVTVASDKAAVQRSIQSFVDRYNDVVDFIRDQTRYDSNTNQAGILLGNPSVIQIQRDMRRAVLGSVPGLAAGSNGLYAVGVSVSATGRLSLDTSKLSTALDKDVDAVARLFQSSGVSTHSKIAFVATSGDTVSRPAGYNVAITRAAARGRLVGASIADPALGGLTIDGSNDKLVLAINGNATSTLSLAHKTYQSGTELANEVAARIKSSTNAVVGVEVVFVDEGSTGHLEIRTQGYGSGYTVQLGTNPSNSALSLLGLAGGTSTAGQDVAGTIDGFEAVGSGQLLKATDPNSPANGLRVMVTLGEDEVGDGVGAIVSVVKGVARQAQDLLDYLTDPVAGYVKSKQDRYNEQLKSYRAQIDRQEKMLDQRRQRLTAQFAALEQAISSLRNQGSFISSQLAGLSAMTSSSGQ